MVSESDDNAERAERHPKSVADFLDWYRRRKKQAMLNDARLSLRQYALKLGLILVFILLDLVLFPSAVQFFIPISMSFFVLWAVGLLILVYIEKVAFAKFIHPD